MSVFTDYIEIHSKHDGDIQDITGKVQASLNNSKLEKGTITVFVPGSTGTVTTIEFEPGLLRDLPEALDRVFPKGLPYHHEMRWHDGNGHSHVRASFMKPDLTIPFVNGSLILGTWQQIVFMELDARPRDRKLVVQIIGE